MNLEIRKKKSACQAGIYWRSDLGSSQLMTGPSSCRFTHVTYSHPYFILTFYHIWEQTPTVALRHFLSLLIQSTFIKCFAPLASTVMAIMQMVKMGRESCAKAAPAHSIWGSQPGPDQSRPSYSCLYSWDKLRKLKNKTKFPLKHPLPNKPI